MAEITEFPISPEALREEQRRERLAAKLAELEAKRQWNETIVEIRGHNGEMLDYRLEPRRFERPKGFEESETQRKLAHYLRGYALKRKKSR